MGTVGYERVGDLAVLRLTRPPVNAMDRTLLADLVDAVREFEASDERAAVLTGEGRALSAGVDLFAVLDGGPSYLAEFLPLLSQAFMALFATPKPVVAAVNGHALAGGCILVCACDRRLMAEGDARIGVTELPVGVPFPSAALELVRFAAAPHRLQEIVLTGRGYLPWEGLEAGLLDEVVPSEALMDRAMQEAAALAAIPSATFEHTKRQLRRPALERMQTHAEHFDALAEAIWASPDVAAAIRSYVEARVGRKG